MTAITERAIDLLDARGESAIVENLHPATLHKIIEAACDAHREHLADVARDLDAARERSYSQGIRDGRNAAVGEIALALDEAMTRAAA